MQIDILSIIFPPLASLAAVFWVYFKILKLAKAKNIVDNPDARKLQKEPIPVLGGMAVFFGIMVGTAVAICLQPDIITAIMPVILMMAVMLYVGALDDISGLTASTRIGIEVLAVLALIFGSQQCLDSLHGLWGVYDYDCCIAIPLTVFAGVGIINAINMIDGVNGLSSGLCITCCILFGMLFLEMGDMPNAILAFVVATALMPFLMHNVFGRTSRMFIGDAGTMTMGILLTWFVIHVLSSKSELAIQDIDIANPVALTVSILVVPICDTLRVMTLRMYHGYSPFHADRTHLHHIFIACGFSHCFTALSEVLIGLLVFAIINISHRLGASDNQQLYILILCGILFVWCPYIILSRISRIPGFPDSRIPRATHLDHSGWWLTLQRLLDSREHLEQSDQKRLSDKLNRKFRN